MKGKIITSGAVISSLVLAIAPMTTTYADEAITSSTTTLSSGTYELTEDVTTSIEIANGAEVTINLNGHTLTNKDGDHTIKNHGKLTITGEGTVDNVTNSKTTIYNYEDGTAYLNVGTFTRSKAAGTYNSGNNSKSNGNSWYTIVNEGTMEINGATVSTDDGHSSLIENGYPDGSKKTNNPTLTIKSGTIDGGKYNVKTDDAGVTIIEGGTFTNAHGNLLNVNELTVNGGTFRSLENYNIVQFAQGDSYKNINGDILGAGNAVVNGGNFETPDGNSVFANVAKKASDNKSTVNSIISNSPLVNVEDEEAGLSVTIPEGKTYIEVSVRGEDKVVYAVDSEEEVAARLESLAEEADDVITVKVKSGNLDIDDMPINTIVNNEGDRTVSVNGMEVATGEQIITKGYKNIFEFEDERFYDVAEIGDDEIYTSDEDAKDAVDGFLTDSIVFLDGSFYLFDSWTVKDQSEDAADDTIINITYVGTWKEIEVTEIPVLEGENTVIYKSKGIDSYSVKIDNDMDAFFYATLDGELLDKSLYEISEGSTIITFTEEGLDLLNDLESGDHVLEAYFGDATVGRANIAVVDDTAIGTTAIKDAKANTTVADTNSTSASSSTASVKTGDVSYTGIWIASIAGAGVIAAVSAAYTVKRRK